MVNTVASARGPGARRVVCRGGRAGSAMAAATGPSSDIAGSSSIAALAFVPWWRAPPVDARLEEVVLDNSFRGTVAMRVWAWIALAFPPQVLDTAHLILWDLFCGFTVCPFLGARAVRFGPG